MFKVVDLVKVDLSNDYIENNFPTDEAILIQIQVESFCNKRQKGIILKIERKYALNCLKPYCTDTRFHCKMCRYGHHVKKKNNFYYVRWFYEEKNEYFRIDEWVEFEILKKL